MEDKCEGGNHRREDLVCNKSKLLTYGQNDIALLLTYEVQSSSDRAVYVWACLLHCTGVILRSYAGTTDTLSRLSGWICAKTYTAKLLPQI